LLRQETFLSEDLFARDEPIAPSPEGAPASEQDPKRRLGNYDTAGEHSIEQPDGKQGPNH
jgi:hypothetical protein